MSGARPQRKSTFRRQAVLILLPVLVLAAVGWMSLRQDRILAEHDARERAGAIVNELIPEIQRRFATPGYSSSFSFRVNEAGQLLFPPSRAPVPTPRPFDLSALNAEQVQLWLKLGRSQDADTTIQTTKDFIASRPPENFAGTACYDLGLQFLRQGKISEAAEMFDLISEKYPQAVGESGLPLRPMAQFQLFEILLLPLATNSVAKISVTPGRWPENHISDRAFPANTLEHFVSVESLCSNIVYQPTLLTPRLLEKIQERVGSPTGARRGPTRLDEQSARVGPSPVAPEVQETVGKWRRTWDDHEESRQLYTAARPEVLAGAVSPLVIEGSEAAEVNRLLAETKTNATFKPPPRFFWVETPEPWRHRAPGADVEIDERTWLIVRSAANQTNGWFHCRAESDVNAEVAALVKEKNIPNYFGVDVELAGKRLTKLAEELGIWHYQQIGGGKTAGQIVRWGTGERASTILATAVNSDGGSPLKVNIYLTSPTALYRRERMRAAWFGGVILVSIASAVIGLVAAWRAFSRQQQLSEMKSNFVSSVSHELRAPIASVRLMAESLDRGKVPEPQKRSEYYRFIVEECRRLSSLIENVLDFSRIEQGRKQYEVQPTDLAALTRETVRLLEPYAGERQVQLKVEIDEEGETSNIQSGAAPPNGERVKFELEVDGRAIQQALVNLIDNAVKHSPKGETVVVGLEVSGEVSGVGCEVSCSGSEATPPSPDTSHRTPDTFVNLYVEDHGPGIPPEEHEKIFERFYRLGSELRRETQGVGIGLSIVKHVVEAHDGRVVVRSAVGQGSRFTIELPIRK